MATDRPDLQTLISRIEALEGADRDLDFWVSYALGSPWIIVSKPIAEIKPSSGEWHLFDADGKGMGWIGSHCVPRLTSSTDAVLSLISERLLGWGFGLSGPHASGQYFAALHAPATGPCHDISGDGNSPATALLASFLRAWDGREKLKEG